MITLHESNITSFPLDNGIGVLSDAITAYAEEELNGLFEFQMEYDSEGFLVDELKEERIIKAKAQDKLGYQLFRIYSITKNHDNDNLIINAQHITYDNADNFVEELIANNMTKKQVMELIGSSAVESHPFNITSTNNTTRSSTKLYRTNPLQMIAGMDGSVLQIWGGQIERDNFNLIMHDRRGHDDGVKVTYEKNITGLTAEFDIGGLITRIYPFIYIEATDDGPERLITVNDKYIDSDYINDYEVIRTEPIDYSSDDRIDTQDKTDAQIRTQLTNIANQYFNETNNDKPKATFDVQFAHLWETEEYKDVAVLELVGMGDTVTTNHSKLKVDATATVNYIRYDCIAMVNEEVKLGSVKARLTDSVSKIDGVVEKVEQVEKSANQSLKVANGKNTNESGPDEPTNPVKGDLWFKEVDGEYTRTYKFDGIQWQLIMDAGVKDIEDTANEARNKANEAVEKANLATANANDAIAEAQTAFDKSLEALDGLTTLNEFVDEQTDEITTIKGGLQGLQTTVSKKVDQSTYTTFVQQTNNSLAGKITMADAEGQFVKGTTFTATIDGLQTSVSNKADKSTVTQLAGVVDTKISTTDADGKYATQSQLTQTASSLQSTIDNIEIGGRNLYAYTKGVVSYTPYNTINSVTENEIKTTLNATGNVNFTIRPNSFRDIQKPNTRYTISGYWFLNDVPISTDFFIRGFNTNSQMVQESLEINSETGYVVITFSTRSDPYSFLFHTEIQVTIGDVVTIRDFQVEKGNKATDWSPAVEDMATQSQITQLSDNINLRVSKNDIINQINISTESVLISGKKLILDGDTTVTGTFRVANANITSVNASKMTTGTLNAANVNIINMNASNIKSGTINAIDIVGSTITSFNTSNNNVVTLENGRITTFSGGKQRFGVYGDGLVAYHWVTEQPVATFRASHINNQKFGADIMAEGDYFTIGKSIGDVGTSRQLLAFYWDRPTGISYDRTDLFGGAGIADSGMLSLQSVASGGTAGARVPRVIIDNRTTDGTAYSGTRVYVGRDNRSPSTTNFRSGFEVWQYKGDSKGGVNQLLKIDKDSEADGSYTNIFTDEVYIDGALTANNHIFTDAIDAKPYGGGTHMYIRPWGNGEVKITSSGTTNVYQNLRAHAVLSQSGIFEGATTDSAQIELLKDSEGARVRSASIYNRTYSGAANMFITSYSTIGRITSARKYKLLEEPMNIDPYNILKIVPKTWYDKSATEAYARLLDENGNCDLTGEDIPTLERIPGAIAEDFVDAGLGIYVTYNEEKEVESLMYDRAWMPLIPIVKDHNDELTILRNQNEELILKVAQLENRLNILEVA